MGKAGVVCGLLAMLTTFPAFAGARFANLQGTVQVFENGKWVKATLASKISDGMTIETGPRSSAVVVFSRGGQMALKAHTRITISDAQGIVGGGTDREMQMVQGEVSGFVKKDLQTPNAFRMRTPTVIAGVRGSLLTARLQGNRFVATAQRSAAYVRPAPKVTAESTKTKALQSALAMRSRITKQSDDAKKILARAAQNPTPAQVADAKQNLQKVKAEQAKLAKAKVQLAAEQRKAQMALSRARTPQAKAAAREQLKKIAQAVAKNSAAQRALTKQSAKVNSVVQAAARAPSAKQLASAKAMIASAEKKLVSLNKSIAAMQKDKTAFDLKVAKSAPGSKSTTDSGPTVELAQGQTVIATGTKVIDPLTVAKVSVRIQATKSVGVSSQEATFVQQNDDSKIGVGNDFQQIYNQINSVTQPASGGLPELSKF